jgi:hypothetical protein
MIAAAVFFGLASISHIFIQRKRGKKIFDSKYFGS